MEVFNLIILMIRSQTHQFIEELKVNQYIIKMDINKYANQFTLPKRKLGKDLPITLDLYQWIKGKIFKNKFIYVKLKVTRSYKTLNHT